MLPEKLAQEYASEEVYSDALRMADLSVPEQIDKPRGPLQPGDLDHAAWWPCGCRLPWWAFRRGVFHFYVRPTDGQHIAYESCPAEKLKAQDRAARSDDTRPKRSRL